MVKIKLTYLRRVGYTQINKLDSHIRQSFLVHLPSSVNYLGGNLVKSC